MQRNACSPLRLPRTVPLGRAAAVAAEAFGRQRGKETLLAATAPALRPAGRLRARSLGKGKVGLRVTLAQGAGLAAPQCCAGGSVLERR